MGKTNASLLVVLIIAVLSLVGCKPGIPGKYLQPDEMADILYDYHLAEGITDCNQNGRDSVALRAFRTSILNHHGVTEAEFDSSMVYYTRHTQLLEDVYKKLADRFNGESVALGGESAGMDGSFASSDTANVWRQASAFVLSPYAATNRLTFELKADTAWHAGDRLMLDFDANFIYQDGMRDASVVLAVTYDNDSTEYVSNNVMSTSHYHMQVNNTGYLHIKSVSGFFLLSSGSQQFAQSTTTLKMLVVSNIRLVRMHTAKPEDKPSADGPGDTNLSGKAPGDSVKGVKPATATKPELQSDQQPRPSGGQQFKSLGGQQLKPIQTKDMKPLKMGK